MRRFYEILPAALAWVTIVLMFVLSWLVPIWVAVFIILFDIYWLLKTVYFSFHLRASYVLMRKNMKIDWLGELERLETNATNTERLEARVPFFNGMTEGNGQPHPNLSYDKERGEQPVAMNGVLPSWHDVYHLVILPMYREPYEVVRESFESLLASHYPMDQMLVVLALEERAGELARETGDRIRAEYGDRFYKFLVTVHPKDLPGEIPGKSSNQSWAAERAQEEIVDRLQLLPEQVIVSVFDIDTQPFPEYFGRVTHAYLTVAEPLRAIYQPIPFFTNNIHDAPAPSRVASFSATFWQMMQQSRPERLTSFSSQSVPLCVVLDIGYWQRDIVSEDSRVFWQAYMRYHGDFRTEPIHYPVSMDANVGSSFWGTVKNVYKQQRRWGWGVENIPYMFEGFSKDPLIPKAKKRYWTWNILESFHSLATNSLMIFALGWLPLILGGHHFNTTVLSYSLPRITRDIINISMLGISGSAVMGVILLPKKPGGISVMDYFWYIIQWALVPFTLTLLGAIPALEAQTRLALGGKYRLGFWVTPKTRKIVGGGTLR